MTRVDLEDCAGKTLRATLVDLEYVYLIFTDGTYVYQHAGRSGGTYGSATPAILEDDAPLGGLAGALRSSGIAL